MADVKKLARNYCLQNAVFYNGRADAGSVIGKIMAREPELRKDVEKVKSEVEKAVLSINRMSPEEQRRELEKNAPELLQKDVKEQKELPELRGARKGRVVTRFAPSPTGALHIQHVLRAAMLNYLYARMYNGRFILRIEDTDPVKTEKRYYEWIKKDLRAVGIRWNRLIIQSDLMGLYRRYGEELIRRGHIYACTCSQDDFRDYKNSGEECQCRGNSVKKNLGAWRKALRGGFSEGEVVFRLRTSMSHPNPVLRDPPMLRVSKATHPLKKKKYHVWPLYNFACVVCDHYSRVTHVFRGKEHEHNTAVQNMIYNFFGWRLPEIINFGMIYLPGEKIHKRDIKEMMESGKVSGWDDPGLPTIRALLRRGFQPEAFRQCAISCGLTKTDIRFDWSMLETLNKRLIDPKANRYMVVVNPVKIAIRGAPRTRSVRMPMHPDFPKRGKKHVAVNAGAVFIPLEDFRSLRGKEIRLKGLFNIKLSGNIGIYAGNKIEQSMPKIQWVSEPNVDVEILMPGETLEGTGERAMKYLKKGDLIQMERVGFARVDSVKSKKITLVFAHK